jgi:hypothetical protein
MSKINMVLKRTDLHTASQEIGKMAKQLGEKYETEFKSEFGWYSCALLPSRFLGDTHEANIAVFDTSQGVYVEANSAMYGLEVNKVYLNYYKFNMYWEALKSKGYQAGPYLALWWVVLRHEYGHSLDATTISEEEMAENSVILKQIAGGSCRTLLDMHRLKMSQQMEVRANTLAGLTGDEVIAASVMLSYGTTGVLELTERQILLNYGYCWSDAMIEMGANLLVD